jgi:FKBP-type peptidyl-prolyl cis-trans isomerase (trigger factor)
MVFFWECNVNIFAEGYDLEIGSGSFIPGFEEQLVGVKTGEEKDVNDLIR